VTGVPLAALVVLTVVIPPVSSAFTATTANPSST
jgi:hypothetical protein